MTVEFFAAAVKGEDRAWWPIVNDGVGFASVFAVPMVLRVLRSKIVTVLARPLLVKRGRGRRPR